MTPPAFPPRRKKQPAPAGETTMTTELGLKLKTLPSYKAAEAIAKLREELEDRKAAIEKRLEDLQRLMKSDDVRIIVARAPGGTHYRFEVVAQGDKIKISKPAHAS